MGGARRQPEATGARRPARRQGWGQGALVAGACLGIALLAWGGAHADPAVIFLGLLTFNGALVSGRA